MKYKPGVNTNASFRGGGQESVVEWNKEQVSDWICSIGYQNYSKQLNISGRELIALNTASLKNDFHIKTVGHQLHILNQIYILKKRNNLSFKYSDYIPESVYINLGGEKKNTDIYEDFLFDLKNNFDLLIRIESDKDLLMANVKNQISSAKNELAYFRDLLAKSNSGGSISAQSPTTYGSSSLSSSNSLSRNHRQGSSPSGPRSPETTIKVYGNKLPGRQYESYKSFKVTPTDDCVKLILDCLQKYKISADWKEYMIILVNKDSAPYCLNPTDRITDVCEKYSRKDPENAFFEVHHIRTQNGPVTKPLNLDPGTFLASHLSLKAVSSAIGIYEYEAQSRVELDVHVGSKFSILARDGEWSVVERNGQRGSVPTSCIYEATTKQNRSQVFVFCIYDYSRRSKNELNVQRGDKLKLLERYHHWCLVQHHDMALIDEGAVGLVPFTYCSSGDSAPTSGDIRRSQSERLTRSYSDDALKQRSRRLSRLVTQDSKHHNQPPTLSRVTEDSLYSPNNGVKSPQSALSSPEEVREVFRSSVQELERYLRQWEGLLLDRQADMPGSVKTLKDIRKLMQYVFSPSSPIHHIILKRPLSGIISSTLDEVCKKNSNRWLQYTNGNLHGMDQKDLDSILYSSIRKNYSSLMKIVNLVLEDSQIATLILKP